MDWLLIGLVVFIILNGLDLYFTQLILKHGGKELNPILGWFYSKSGIRGAGIFKVFILLLFFLSYFAGILDMWTIWYVDFSYTVLLLAMLWDFRKTQLKRNLVT